MIDKNYNIYRKDIEQFPLLTIEEERKLGSIIQNKNNDADIRNAAKQKLVTSNLRIVVKMANEFFNRMPSSENIGLTIMDIIQAGNIGLIKAAESYDPVKAEVNETRFVSYAYKSIIRHITVYTKNSRFIHVPRVFWKYFCKMAEMEAGENEISEEDLLKQLNVNHERLDDVQKNRSRVVFIEDVNCSDSEDLVFDPEDPYPFEEKLYNKEILQYLKEKINHLSPTHKDIIQYKFFDDENALLSDYGKKHGISREAARTKYNRALKSLRKIVKNDLGKSKII